MATSFLNIPGELRNRVYQFVAEHDAKVVKIKHRSIIDCSDNYWYDNRDPSHDDWDLWHDDFYSQLSFDRMKKEKASYACLTRVCRQIRAEYLPCLVEQRENRRDLKVYANYSSLGYLPTTILDYTHPFNPVEMLYICVPKKSIKQDSYVDLLPVLRAQTQLGLDSSVFRASFLDEKLFESYLLLKRILKYNRGDWLALFREPVSVDAVLFNMVSKKNRDRTEARSRYLSRREK